MFADLHCHTKLSDGSANIEELIFIAKHMHVKAISVTDHDTFAGAKRAMVVGNRFGVNVILGAEFSSFSSKFNKNVHLLCYMCDYPDRLESLCKKNFQIRQANNMMILQKIMRFYPISPEIVSIKSRGSSNIFKNHILQAVMDAGYNFPDYASVYDKTFNSEAINSLFLQKYPEPEYVIAQIHESGGLAVMAHPCESEDELILNELLKVGIDGVEAFCPNIDEEKRKRLVNFAKSNGIALTGGSNFHGMYSSYPRILGSFGVDEATFDFLIKCKTKLFKSA
ncbi:MAG: PHP domain-containing protein [Oscillospiraceae bacterium]|nr:PHP domain-containing protein [Oscillospiraceae bacterium]